MAPIREAACFGIDPFAGPSSPPPEGDGRGRQPLPSRAGVGEGWGGGERRRAAWRRGSCAIPPESPSPTAGGTQGGARTQGCRQPRGEPALDVNVGPRPGASEARAQRGARTRGPRASGEAAGGVTGPARGAVRRTWRGTGRREPLRSVRPPPFTPMPGCASTRAASRTAVRRPPRRAAGATPKAAGEPAARSAAQTSPCSANE